MNRLSSMKTIPHIHDYIVSFEQLADEAAMQGYFGLQDCCLLLTDALRENQETGDSPLPDDFLRRLAKFPDLDDYQQNVTQCTPVILGLLQAPELNLPLADEEFEQLENQLLAGNGESGEFDVEDFDAIPATQNSADLNDSIQQINLIADEAGIENFLGLQEVALLLTDACGRLLEEENHEAIRIVQPLLNEWLGGIAAYKNNPADKAGSIFEILQCTDLKIGLSGDEYIALADMVAAGNEETVPEPDYNADPAATEKDQDSADNIPTLSQQATTTNAFPKATQEILDMLLMLVEMISRHINDFDLTNEPGIKEGLNEIDEQFSRLALVTETAGFNGLSTACELIGKNLKIFIKKKRAYRQERHELLLEICAQIKVYLLNFTDESAGQMLVVLLCDPRWDTPLTPEDAAVVLVTLRTSESDISPESTRPKRTQTATPSDVSLELPSDVNQELLDLMLQELPEQTRQFSEAIQNLQSGGSIRDVEIAQRIAHTLKGSANTVGIKGIAELTHALEDILTECAKEQKLPGKSLAGILLNATDCLEGMSEALAQSGLPPNDALQVLQEVLDIANRIDQEGSLPEDSQIEAGHPRTKAGTGDEPEEAASAQSQITTIRVPSDQIEDLFRLSGESIILNTQATESMRRMSKQLQAMKTQFTLLQELGAELEQLIDLKDLTGRSIKAVDSNFDALEMDQYNELHTASRRMAEAAIDAREISLDIGSELDRVNEILEYQQRMVVDAQEVVMQTRLVAISTIAARLQRSLRQTCRMTGKDCELTLHGDSLMIDGDILNSLVDPLMHILRNAIDHGIESLEDRKLLGKPDKGSLAFKFDREGNTIVVRCQDDGKGLDYGAIRAAAETRGLLTPGQAATEDELKSFILRPNFSSRTTSTQTSGRGVGMDVVRAQILSLGGLLTLHSVQGQGMTIELRVPLPLSMTYALLTHAGPYRIAIANKGIDQIIYSAAGTVHIDEDGKEILTMEGVSYETFRLIDMLSVPDPREIPRPYSAILMVQGEQKTSAVLLDAIYDSMNAVIKGFGQYLGKIPGYIGVTILGDGTIIPVVDIPELIRTPMRKISADAIHRFDAVEPQSKLPTILVVDDSLSQRRALEQLLTDSGYRVRTARDGTEATEILANFRPDVVLTDLEMPRMNGIELTHYIRSHAHVRSLPIIMITSRTTQKHKQMAEDAGVNSYITKPVREEQLLDEMQTLMELSPGQQHQREIA